MNLAPLQRLGILAALAILLIGTGTDHFGPLPNAAMAVFFLAGFYAGNARWALPALVACALITDYAAVTASGQSFWTHHCVSVAYWLLVPAYGSLWLGGAWLGKRYRPNFQVVLPAAGALLAAFTVAFTLTNGGYYWLGGRYADPSWLQFVERYAHYYPAYLRTAAAYTGFAALLHLQALLLLRYLPRLTSPAARN